MHKNNIEHTYSKVPNKRWRVLINRGDGGHCLIKNLISGGLLINKRWLLKIKICKTAKAFVYGYMYNCMAKYPLYFIYRGIPPELGVPKIRTESAREHLCKIVV